MNGLSATSLARALCANPHLSTWEASRLCVLAANALAWFRLGVPRRHLLRSLIEDIHDYERVPLEARRTAMLDIAAAVYPW